MPLCGLSESARCGCVPDRGERLVYWRGGKRHAEKACGNPAQARLFLVQASFSAAKARLFSIQASLSPAKARLFSDQANLSPAKACLSVRNFLLFSTQEEPFGKILVKKDKTKYAISIESNLADELLQVRATKKSQKSIIFKVTTNGDGNAKFTTRRVLSGYQLALLFDGKILSSVKAG